MNTINFQPTGVYPQIAKKPDMLCQAPASCAGSASFDTVEMSKPEKDTKRRKLLGIGGALALAGTAVFAYKKNIGDFKTFVQKARGFIQKNFYNY